LEFLAKLFKERSHRQEKEWIYQLKYVHIVNVTVQLLFLMII
jgi:hypothetical protein